MQQHFIETGCSLFRSGQGQVSGSGGVEEGAETYKTTLLHLICHLNVTENPKMDYVFLFLCLVFE